MTIPVTKTPSRTVPIAETMSSIGRGFPDKLVIFKIHASSFWWVRYYANGKVLRKTTKKEGKREAIAFAKFATEKLLDTKHEVNLKAPVHFKLECFDIDRNQVQNLISQHAGIIKNTKGLQQALAALQFIKSNAVAVSFDPYQFASGVLLDVGILLIEDALRQDQNRGVFYNEDLVNDLVP